jgi:ferric-dicitrate binding protein FerR (iron transport regulator)
MDKHTKEYFDISVLLYKKQSGLLSNEEELVLNEWRGSSLENQEIYDRMSADLNIEEKKNQYDGIDASAAWEKLDDKLNEKKPIERRLFTQFIKYAAVLILPLAIGAFLVFQVMDSTEYSSDLVEQINPGSTKATLVLSDGKTVDLEKEVDTLIEGSALNKDQKLIYQEKQEQLAHAKPRWHKLVVPVGGEYELKLVDGTKVILNSNSELKYTDRFVGKQRLVYLKGEAYFDVAKDKEHPFIVKTSSMDVKVFGTQFNVMDYEEEVVSQTTLVEGSVAVSVKNESGIVQSAMLKPDMQVEYVRGDVKLQVKNVDASAYVGWIHGKFQFNNEDLGSIMRKLSRWYDVKFFTQNREIQNIKYTGEFKRFDDFATVLNLLEIGSGVEFEVNGKNVIARSKNN